MWNLQWQINKTFNNDKSKSYTFYGRDGTIEALKMGFMNDLGEYVQICTQKNIHLVTKKGALKVKSPYSSEPITVNTISATDDYVTTMDSEVMKNLFKLTGDVTMVTLDDIFNLKGHGTKLTKEKVKDSGTDARQKAYAARKQSV
eukprot:UN26084